MAVPVETTVQAVVAVAALEQVVEQEVLKRQ